MRHNCIHERALVGLRLLDEGVEVEEILSLGQVEHVEDIVVGDSFHNVFQALFQQRFDLVRAKCSLPLAHHLVVVQVTMVRASHAKHHAWVFFCGQICVLKEML